MDKPIVLFDFDRTLFDNTRYASFLANKISRVLGINPEELHEIHMGFIALLKADREYDPEKYVYYLCERFNFGDQRRLLDVYYGEESKRQYKDFIFPEAFEILDSLKKRYKLGIYSEGTLKFQKFKIYASEITKEFDKDLIFILANKSIPSVLAKIPEGSTVIDDKKSVCQYLTESGIKCIWLNKKGEEDSKDFPTVHTLLEVKDKLL